jgi:hypothetical protein
MVFALCFNAQETSALRITLSFNFAKMQNLALLTQFAYIKNE